MSGRNLMIIIAQAQDFAHKAGENAFEKLRWSIVFAFTSHTHTHHIEEDSNAHQGCDVAIKGY